MRPLSPWCDNSPIELLLLGAHADDIEIGCGGAVLRWIAEGRVRHATWVVLSAMGQREAEAHAGATAFLAGVTQSMVRVEQFADGFLPFEGRGVKELLEALKATAQPDVVLTHDLLDRHQDHRLLAELTWQTFRDHLILEYEVPKYDAGLGDGNTFVELPEWVAAEKVRRLLDSYPSQTGRHWFTADTFTGLARIRGVECRSSTGLAEAFRCRKLVLS